MRSVVEVIRSVVVRVDVIPVHVVHISVVIVIPVDERVELET